jgi:hypothetical protein
MRANQQLEARRIEHTRGIETAHKNTITKPVKLSSVGPTMPEAAAAYASARQRLKSGK